MEQWAAGRVAHDVIGEREGLANCLLQRKRLTCGTRLELGFSTKGVTDHRHVPRLPLVFIAGSQRANGFPHGVYSTEQASCFLMTPNLDRETGESVNAGGHRSRIFSLLCEDEAFSTPHGRARVVAACSESVAQAPQEAGNGRWHPKLPQDVHRFFLLLSFL